MSVARVSPAGPNAALIAAMAGALLCAGTAAAAPTPAAHPNFSGFWEPPSDSMKRHGRPAFTPAAVEAMKPPPPGTPEAVWADNGIDDADANCLAPAQPWTLVQSAPIDFIQDDNELMILNEKRSSPVHIYLDGRSHPDMAHYRRSLNGHSVGRWEGDELVVDTIGFANHGPGHGPIGELPHTETLHLIQRFHLEKDGQELHAQFTIEDPAMLTEPFVYDFTWRKLPASKTYAITEICDPRDPARLEY